MLFPFCLVPPEWRHRDEKVVGLCRGRGGIMKKNRRERGQTVIESTFAMLLLCLVLFGLLQIFHLYVAQMLTDFSAFYTARSKAVGFADYITERSGRVLVASASGPRVWPSDTTSDSGINSSTMYGEEMMLHEYITGERWLEYQYWNAGNSYGEEWSSSAEAPRTYFNQGSITDTNGQIRSTAAFYNYPFALFDLMDPGRVWFGNVAKDVLIQAVSQQADYSAYYLGE